METASARAAQQLRADVARPSLSLRVRARMLMQRDHTESHALASSLRVSPRTLHRRLASEGERLSDLQQKERLQRALIELARFDRSIEQVAERLGYSQTAASTRAFKRWTGVTPAKYRKGMTR